MGYSRIFLRFNIFLLQKENHKLPLVYVLILNYKKWKDVAECLEALFRSHYDNFIAVVIDNYSKNNSIEELMRWADSKTMFLNRKSIFTKDLDKPVTYKYYKSQALKTELDLKILPRLVFVQNESNKGFAGGINSFLRHIVHENAYTWLLNPDMVVEEDTLGKLSRFASMQPVKSIIGSVIKNYYDTDTVHFYGGGKINFYSATIGLIKKKKDVHTIDYISGRSLFTHAGSFNDLGLLPEDYFLYWEETDWCYTAKNRGYQLRVCDSAVCYDKISTSIGKGFLSDFYYTRNGLIFLSKFRKSNLPVAMVLTIVRFFKRVINGSVGRAAGVMKGLIAFSINRNENK